MADTVTCSECRGVDFHTADCMGTGVLLRSTTWADGFGRWHAAVPFTGSRARDAAAARRLIMAELVERAPRNAPAPVFRITRERVTNHGTVVYGEQS